MTINEIRELLAEEYAETAAYIDKMDEVSEGDQFPLEDLVLKATLEVLLKACSEEQVSARAVTLVAARKRELEEDESLPF